MDGISQSFFFDKLFQVNNYKNGKEWNFYNRQIDWKLEQYGRRQVAFGFAAAI